MTQQQRLYRTYFWEKGGEIYQRIFRVRAWKDHLPSGGSLYPNNFSIKTLRSMKVEYLERWLRESCRAEFCHWIMILPGFLFFLWNSVEMAWGMVFYAVLNNVFPIVLQRFNRPRMRRMLALVWRVSIKEKALATQRGYEQEKAIINSYN